MSGTIAYEAAPLYPGDLVTLTLKGSRLKPGVLAQLVRSEAGQWTIGVNGTVIGSPYDTRLSADAALHRVLLRMGWLATAKQGKWRRELEADAYYAGETADELEQGGDPLTATEARSEAAVEDGSAA